MNITEFENKFNGKELWVVADGPSCPQIGQQPETPILAVNYGYKNINGKPFGLVYTDAKFRKRFEENLSECADVIFHSQHSGMINYNNSVSYRKCNNRQARLRDGVYTGKPPDGFSAGIAAVSLAIGMGPKLIRLFGFDYRVYTAEESTQIFGEIRGVHKSIANHKNTDVEKEHSRNIYNKKIRGFDLFANYNIINHCETSNLYQFPRIKFNIEVKKHAS